MAIIKLLYCIVKISRRLLCFITTEDIIKRSFPMGIYRGKKQSSTSVGISINLIPIVEWLLKNTYFFPPNIMWTSCEDVRMCVVLLPLKTWWLFLRSVWRPPHSFFKSCRVSCSNSPATSLTERLPDREGGGEESDTRSWRRSIDVVFINIFTHCCRHAHKSFLSEISSSKERSVRRSLIDSSRQLFWDFTEREKKHLCHCLSVLVRVVKCAQLKLLQQAVRATSMHFTAASTAGRLRAWVIVVTPPLGQ